MKRVRWMPAFTMVEVLMVIAIMMVIVAMALPNFMEMMRSRRWGAAVAGVQGMVIRARALATNIRRDFSVEFRVQDNGTSMWIESEENDVERMPDLWELQHELGGDAPLRYFITGAFYQAGGRYKNPWYECVCTTCGTRWSNAGSRGNCPSCGNTGPWNYPIVARAYYYDFTYDPSLATASSFGDNARQSDVVPLGLHMTVDLTRSKDFFSWDSRTSVVAYGYDEYPDIRLGTNGAMIQTREPIICIKDISNGNRRAITVVRCTGRVKNVQLP